MTLDGGDVIRFTIVAIGGWYFVGKPLYSSLRSSGSGALLAVAVSFAAIVMFAALLSLRGHLSHALYSPTGDWK
jgi:hypothetical protein